MALPQVVVLQRLVVVSDLFGGGVHRDAVLSADGRYRFRLERSWGDGCGTLNAVMLNPSYANSTRDDSTVTQLMVRARAMGFRKLVVTNCSPYRSRDPFALRLIDQEELLGPIQGSINSHHLEEAARGASMVLCAWGGHAFGLGLHGPTVKLLRSLRPDDLYVLKLNRDGTPHHPLRLPYEVRPTAWRLPG